MRLVAALLALCLAACQPLPQPFADEARQQNPLARLRSGGGVGVTVQGLPAPVAGAIAQTAVDAFTAAEVPAMTGPGSRASFALSGEGAVERESGQLVLSLVWHLTDPDGRAVGEFGERLPLAGDAWPDRAALAALATRTAAAFLDAVREPAPPVGEPGGILVAVADGVPGDGAVALKRAMEAVLKGQGVDLAKAEGPRVAKLRAEVVLGPPAAGEQPVSIRWQLVRPDGRPVGTITQSNKVKAGSLDHNWGDTALLVAEAAYDGVAQLLRRLPEEAAAR